MRMQKRFAAGEREHERPEARHVIDALLEQGDVDRRGDLVILGAVSAGQIAATRHHELNEKRPSWGREHQCAALQAAERVGGQEHRDRLV